MKIKNTPFIAALLAALYCGGANAQNPIIQTKFTADPAPMVYKDTVYLYVDHDEDTNNGFFNMKEWMLYKSADMVNWTDCGVVGSLHTFAWGNQNNGAWALQCIPRNGKFYIYCPIQLWGIGVAVADTPYGPFKDALDKFLINNSSDDIDPTAFIDDDGQAYLYWGNPKPYYVKLNKDMISYSGYITMQVTNPEHYTEGPWIYKRNGKYYLLYASHGIPENLSYATSTMPTGPWTYQGIIMNTQKGCAFTNHCGVVDFKGSSYLFYHDQRLSLTDGFKRSVSVERFNYNADGSFPTISMTAEGVTTPVCNVNPYNRVEAETMAFESGIETNHDDKCGMFVDRISNGDYIKVRSVDFGSNGADLFTASVASDSNGSTIELHINAVDGTLVGTLNLSNTANEWKTESTAVSNCTGVHDLFLVFKGDVSSKALFKFDWWKFGPTQRNHGENKKV